MAGAAAATARSGEPGCIGSARPIRPAACAGHAPVRRRHNRRGAVRHNHPEAGHTDGCCSIWKLRLSGE
jgi:hypothetical protein